MNPTTVGDAMKCTLCTRFNALFFCVRKTSQVRPILLSILSTPCHLPVQKIGKSLSIVIIDFGWHLDSKATNKVCPGLEIQWLSFSRGKVHVWLAIMVSLWGICIQKGRHILVFKLLRDSILGSIDTAFITFIILFLALSFFPYHLHTIKPVISELTFD